MRKIVAIGRGGVGKTSFIALMTKYLKARKKSSVLLIDADPDESLAGLVGVDLESMQIKTVSDLLLDVRRGDIDEKLKSFTLTEKIKYLINHSALYEGEDFDLLSIGTKWSEGCYCQPNNILKGLITGLEESYDYILVDSPAGLEHLNRRITSSVDDIFAIMDPSRKAFQHLQRAYKIISEIKIRYINFYVLGNFRFSEELLSSIDREPNFKYIGKLEFDRNVEDFNLQGKSLFKLKDDSPMLVSVKNIATAVGY
jgi:CO dehydrogenase maturation factor